MPSRVPGPEAISIVNAATATAMTSARAVFIGGFSGRDLQLCPGEKRGQVHFSYFRAAGAPRRRKKNFSPFFLNTTPAKGRACPARKNTPAHAKHPPPRLAGRGPSPALGPVAVA